MTEVKGYWPFCQIRCIYTAKVQDGKILSVTGDKNNHWTGGTIHHISVPVSRSMTSTTSLRRRKSLL